MKKLLLILMWLIGCELLAKEIIIMEVYALPFNRTYIIGIKKKSIRSNYDLGIKIKKSEIINSLNIKQTLMDLKLTNKFKAAYFGDFRAFIIIRFENGKRRKFYITGTGYIIENKKVYEFNLDFLKMTYYYLPDNFKPYYKIWENN